MVKKRKNKKIQVKARPRTKLLSKFSLVLLVLVSVLFLWLVAPSKSMLVKLISRSTSPEVSLAFLRVLNNHEPNNRDIQLLMLQSSYRMGDISGALAIAEPLLVEPKDIKDWYAYALYLDLLLEGFFSGNTELQVETTHILETFFARIDYIPEPNLARKFVDAAIMLGMADHAFRLLEPHLETAGTNHAGNVGAPPGSLVAESAYQLQLDSFIEDESYDLLKKFFDVNFAGSGIDQSSTFLKNDKGLLAIEPSFLTSTIEHASNSGDESYELIPLQRRLSEKNNLQLLSGIAGLAVAQGSLEQATAVLEISYGIEPDREITVRLHQLYLWQDDIEKAFEMSLLIVADNPTEEQLREAIAEAKALGDIYHEGLFYDQLANNGKIKPPEYKNWLNALEKAEGTNAALLSADRLSKQHPQDTVLFTELARLHAYSSNHQRVIQQYEKLKSYRKPTVEEARLFANAYFMLNQPQKALDMLTAPNGWLASEDDYLRVVSSLAWDLSNRKLVLATQQELIERSIDNLDVYRYIQLNGPFSVEDIPELVTLYEQSGNEALLLLAIRSAYESGNPGKLEELLALASKNDRIKNSTEILYFGALLAVHQNEHKTAHRLFMETLRVDSAYLPAITSYLWWAIDIKDKKTIAYLYQTYSLPLKENNELWPAFAAASQQLGNYNHAEQWYKKLLVESENDEPDVAVLLNYASLLERREQYDQAYRLRKYIVRHLSAELLTLHGGDVTLRSLVAMFAGEAKALELATNSMLHNLTANSAAEFFQYQLALNQTEAVRFWHQRTMLADYRLPDWQQLAIAIHDHDKPAMDALLAESLNLPPAAKYHALQATGHHQLAWQEGQEKIGQLANASAEEQLRKTHVNQHPDKTHSIRSQYETDIEWEINKFSVDYYSPHRHGNWRLGMDFQTADPPDILTGNDIDDEFRLRGSYVHQSEQSNWLFGLDFADGIGDQRLGFKASYHTALGSNWNGSVKLGLNNDIQASQLLAIAGSDNLVGFNLIYQPTVREGLSLSFNFHDVSTRFEDDIGSGWDGSIRASEQIFFADPAWQIYGEYQMHRVNLSDDPINGMNSWNQGPNTLTSADFIDDKYQRLALGQRLWHGEPGIPGPTVPSPRYLLDTSVGYNFITDNPDVKISSGIEWAIVGSDALYFTVDWQSQDRNGDESLKVSLGYYYSF